MGTQHQDRLLDLLDRAYDVSDNQESFDSLLDAARSYFFESADKSHVAKGVPRYAGLDPHIERHIPRLDKLMSSGGNAGKMGLTLDHHAQITLSPIGNILDINPQAAAFFCREGDKPEAGQSFKSLSLSYDSEVLLRDILKTKDSDREEKERIIYLQNDQIPPIGAFAFCRFKLGEPLHISLSQFEWTDQIFRGLETALSLSESEGHVLRGTLLGLSQKEIAAKHGKSVDTIKTQAKAVLRKSGCAKMGDIVHLATSIAYVVGLSGGRSDGASAGEDIWQVPKENMSSLPLKDGRTLTWYEYGPRKGRPVLFIHGFALGPFFTGRLRRAFRQHNIRIIAPVRPSFGFTDPALSSDIFDQTVSDDTAALLAHLKLSGPFWMLSHQGGVSHGFRIAKRFEDQVQGMLMVGAGIPITQDHIQHMDRQTQLAAVAMRHAPSVLKLTLSLGIKSYKKRGAEAFLRRHYDAPSPDKESLNDPEMLQLQKWACYMLTQQGPKAFMQDGAAAMADWTEDFDAVSCQQSWIHGAQCPVMGAKFVESYVTRKTNYPVEIVQGAGFNVLYQAPDKVMVALMALLDS